MGCKLAKLASSEFNHQDPLHRPPPPSDPRSPLTAKQQYCMLASWKGIFRQIEKTGIILFINYFSRKNILRALTLTRGDKLLAPSTGRAYSSRVQLMLTPELTTLLYISIVRLFEENEDLLHLFEKFRELGTKHELSTSAELAEHATKVMHTLDEGIKGMADVDAFFAYIRHVGATHHQVPGFKAENFWKIEQPFLEAAKTTLGDRYTENIENIYKLTIRFILENLVKGYEESSNKETETETATLQRS